MFSKVTKFFQGRHTLFIVACMTIGSVMSYLGKLDSNLVTLLLGLQGMVTLHSAKEDYFQGNKCTQ